ncbi:MAG: DMT family transporter [Bauldia sp.]|nr:DMT family transporter [Bauldia sp.]
MLKGVALGFLTYALFSSADATIKSLGGALPVVEIVFFATLFSSVVILFLRPRGERWRDTFRMHHPKRVMLRAACGIIAGIGSVFAFTTIPLAEAYALIFLSPVLVTVLSIPLLGERIGWRRLSAVGVGFLGMLLVVRPGFRELHPGHVAGIVVAAAGAVSMIILRMIGQSERRVSLVGVVMVSATVFNGLLMIPVFVWPDAHAFARLGFIGIVGGIGQMTLLAATRAAPANRVAPAQYSQIVWAVVLGALFFAEFPDWLALAGIGLIGFSGLFTFLREDKVTGWPRRTPVLRNRL